MNRITLALGVALAALVAAAPIAARPSAATVTTVTVTMKEFKFVLSKKTVRHGKVTFKLVNKGTIPHDFKIAGKIERRQARLQVHRGRPCRRRHEGQAHRHVTKPLGAPSRISFVIQREGAAP